MLSVDSISASYHSQPFLRDISFQVKPGQIVALIGRNGAGKTTLIRAISCILSLLSGRTINGSDTRAYISALMKASPNTTVLVDEAYYEYATMPGYETMIPLALQNPRVVVARTFSKCFGMAGIRIGYAIGHRDTIKKMTDWDAVGNITVMALQGAKAALAVPDSWVKDEQKRNEAAPNFTQKWFADRGYTPTNSQTNFMFINVKRPAREFREACLKEGGVLIGRDFPPYEKTHVRISIGTMDEMREAVQVFDRVLSQPAKAAAARRPPPAGSRGPRLPRRAAPPP